MSLVFSASEATPQTHVFIIGIGGYSYLKDGIKANNSYSQLFNQMGQLTSAPVSAAAFYKKVLALHEEEAWIKPLGSVEMLISPAPDAPDLQLGMMVDAASMSNIKNSYDQWHTRCNSHPDNVAIFYFCGHGLEKGQHFLLTEDFHKRPLDPWEGAFNIDMTRMGFNSCQAGTKLFLIDACRSLTRSMLRFDITVQSLETPEIGNQEADYFLFQKASAPNESAFGRKNDISIYTQALINALGGAAAEPDEHDQWNVDISGIASQMLPLMRNVQITEGYKQRCWHTFSDTTSIIRFKHPPKVILQLSCDPDEAHPYARLTCTHVDTLHTASRNPAPGPWEVPVDPGIYRVSAIFTQAPYQNRETFVNANPPRSSKKIICI